MPILNKKLFFTELLDFFRNSEKHNIEIVTAEYEIDNLLIEKIFEFLCITFSRGKYSHTKIGMLYTSFINKNIEDYLLKELVYSKKKSRDFKVGIGAIATGIMGNEPILSPKELEYNLRVLKREKIDNIVIYRLGGLNKRYLEIINKFVNNRNFAKTTNL